MKEDFDTDERDKIDDLFRDTLAGYTEEPRGDMWARLNRRLNRKEFVYFITFKKNFGNEAAENNVIPLYRQQWFRGAVAACIVLLVMFASTMITTKVYYHTDNNKNLAVNNADIKTRVMQDENNNNSYYNWELIIANPYSSRSNDYIAWQNERVNNIIRMPNLIEKQDVLSPLNNDALYADNNRQYKQKMRNNRNNMDNNNVADNALERNFVPLNNNFNDNQPIVADNGMNNTNNPLTDINVRNGQNNNYVERNNSARRADSVIKANTIKENDEKQPLNIERNDNYNQNSEPVNNQVNENKVIEKPVVPNMFSPNGDGSNDYFVIKNLEYYTDNMLVVVGRNGKTVFQKKEYQGDWNADNVPDGTYFYVLTYKNAQKETQTIKGTVYIIR